MHLGPACLLCWQRLTRENVMADAHADPKLWPPFLEPFYDAAIRFPG